ncbi:MAG: CDP-diacylglycerol--glycerol-3-phosphate 3-phosphatidyltransferase [Clostridiales bacterium]|jgi:CDP-diacylglycerol--glycerol-3-phosphate 3-phosphatidyltransferase|nr:CDP-diacylglycerol--glycerol-3-phosphate 3-phosphatidyltransferase [Clostridiales bacterium]
MNLPNKITLIRIVLIPFFLAAFMLREYTDWLVYVSAGLFVLASVTDFLDGHIARKYNMVTDMGKFLDPIADKVLVAAALFLVLGYALIPPMWGVIFVTVIIGREFAVSALRQVAATRGKVIAADKIGKVKTAVTLVALTAMLVAKPLDWMIRKSGGGNVVPDGSLFITYGTFQWIGFCLLAAAVLLTLVSGVHYIVKNREVFREDKGIEN